MLTWHADMAADVALPASHFLSGVANSYAIGSVLRGCYKIGSKGVGLGLQVHGLVPKMVSNSYQEDLCPSQLRDADVSTSGYCSRCVDNVAMRSESNHFSDNGGCTIKVEIHDGPYNMIKNWNYTALVDAIHNGEGKCWMTKVRCEEDLVEAIETATGEKKILYLLH
ncbi:hypothetical protein AgCh_025554 [Apium graveolens]